MLAAIASLLVSEQPQPRQVQLPDGTVHTLHFRQLSAAVFRRHLQGLQEKDTAAQSQAMAALIAASLCNPDGSAALTPDQALQLTAGAERALSDAVMEVNGLGRQQGVQLGNDLPPGATSGSGTS